MSRPFGDIFFGCASTGVCFDTTLRASDLPDTAVGTVVLMLASILSLVLTYVQSLFPVFDSCCTVFIPVKLVISR